MTLMHGAEFLRRRIALNFLPNPHGGRGPGSRYGVDRGPVAGHCYAGPEPLRFFRSGDILPDGTSTTIDVSVDNQYGTLMNIKISAWVSCIWMACAPLASMSAQNADTYIDSFGYRHGNVVPYTRTAVANAKGAVRYCVGKPGQSTSDLVEQFNRDNPQLRVELVTVPGTTDEYGGPLDESIWNGTFARNGCDVLQVMNRILGTGYESGQFFDLTPFVEDGRLARYPERIRPAFQYNGHFLGLTDSVDFNVLVYRTDRVATPPATWEELYARTAQDPSHPYIYSSGITDGQTFGSFVDVAVPIGGGIISADQRAGIADRPENLAAFSFMMEGVKAGGIKNPADVLNDTAVYREFARGDANYMLNWTTFYGPMLKETPGLTGKTAIAPLPHFAGKPRAVTAGSISDYVVLTASKNPEGAMKFIDFMTSTGAQKLRALRDQSPPAFIELLDDPDVRKAIPYWQTLKSSFADAIVRPSISQDVMTIVDRRLSDAFHGALRPADAFALMQKELTFALRPDAIRHALPSTGATVLSPCPSQRVLDPFSACYLRNFNNSQVYGQDLNRDLVDWKHLHP
ncbi:extracellular solute-binding protein [Burkholderia cenocepacia]|uniref:extracellular solute-binding protein n=1 Tax=Burkholderia cenocepacia TaxID=95486 RepID=UPI002AB6545B|nr:extracellular solute-binding protein [Burkholderia cenocepacia]